MCLVRKILSHVRSVPQSCQETWDTSRSPRGSSVSKKQSTSSLRAIAIGKDHLAGSFCHSLVWAHRDVLHGGWKRWVEGPVIENLSARRGYSARSLRTSLMENHFRNINYSTPHSGDPCGLCPKIRATLASMISWWSFSKKHVIILL